MGELKIVETSAERLMRNVTERYRGRRGRKSMDQPESFRYATVSVIAPFRPLRA